MYNDYQYFLHRSWKKNIFTKFYGFSLKHSSRSGGILSFRKSLKSFFFRIFSIQNCGSQESIIQLDLDDEDESDASPADQRRRYSVSPMPQIRSSESQVRNEIYKFWWLLSLASKALLLFYFHWQVLPTPPTFYFLVGGPISKIKSQALMHNNHFRLQAAQRPTQTCQTKQLLPSPSMLFKFISRTVWLLVAWLARLKVKAMDFRARRLCRLSSARSVLIAAGHYLMLTRPSTSQRWSGSLKFVQQFCHQTVIAMIAMQNIDPEHSHQIPFWNNSTLKSNFNEQHCLNN